MRLYFVYQEKEYSDEEFNQFANSIIHQFFEKTKYKALISLRPVEKEINEQGGAIIIHDTGKVVTREFTEELCDEIFRLLNEGLGGSL